MGEIKKKTVKFVSAKTSFKSRISSELLFVSFEILVKKEIDF